MKKILKRVLDVEYFLPNVLIPLLILAVYGASFAVIYDQFILEGINGFFAGLLFIILLPIIIILLVIYLPLTP